MDKEKWTYALIRIAMFPFSLMPYTWLHFIGRRLGALAFYLLRSYRKRTLSNLALANDLHLNHKQLIKIAKQSFQNLAINCLEYAKLARETNFSRVFSCENPEIATDITQQGKGLIFFCGHLSNWEVQFLDGTSRMKGIAIGRPIKNKRLYNWVLNMREKNGGKIVTPRNAVKEGLRALKKGEFIGIVGDQSMPDSGYSFPFLGRRAWTSTAPALLAYKTNCPIIFAATRRIRGGYRIRYADPIWPNTSQPLESEVIRMMDKLLSHMQESVKRSPGEWLWQHNRWKQQTMHTLYKRFRQDSILIILTEQTLELLPTLKEIYPLAFLSLLVPAHCRHHLLIAADEILYYHTPEQTLLSDYRFKLVFNFTDYKPIHSHYEKLSVLDVLDLPTLKQLAAQHLQPQHNLSDTLKRALCRPGSIWKNDTK